VEQQTGGAIERHLAESPIMCETEKARVIGEIP
jgi:hypothetical protein